MSHPAGASPARRRRRSKLRPLPPAPRRSQRFYVELPPAQVGMFRFLLEAHDNLALFTVLSRQRAVLQLSCAPGREAELRQALADMSLLVAVRLLELPRMADSAAEDIA